MIIATESITEATAKLAPAVSVASATFFGYQVSDLVLWTTLIYTSLMIIHKCVAIIQDFNREDA